MGGSYFVEELTNQVEAEAWKYIEKIDAMGGSVSAIEEGYMQNEIATASYKYQKDIEKSEKVIVGVNKFTVKEEVAPPSFRINDSIRIEQTGKLNQLKAERNNALVKANIESLEQAAKDGRNVMPHIIEAVENLATLGEIADTFRGVFGEYKA
jgi:methylmalonyl-CoA mutase N-terminal domain/subunit